MRSELLLTRRDSPWAVDALLRQHTPIVRRVAAKYRPPRAASYEDVVQVGLLAVVEAIKRYDAARCEWMPHLTLTVRRRIIDYTRDRCHLRERAHDADTCGLDLVQERPTTRPGPERAVVERETLWELAEGIRALPPRQRLCLVGITNGRSAAQIDPSSHSGAIYASANLGRSKLKLLLAA